MLTAKKAKKIALKKYEKNKRENIKLVLQAVKQSANNGNMSEEFKLRTESTLYGILKILRDKGYDVVWNKVSKGGEDFFEVRVSWL